MRGVAIFVICVLALCFVPLISSRPRHHHKKISTQKAISKIFKTEEIYKQVQSYETDLHELESKIVPLLELVYIDIKELADELSDDSPAEISSELLQMKQDLTLASNHLHWLQHRFVYHMLHHTLQQGLLQNSTSVVDRRQDTSTVVQIVANSQISLRKKVTLLLHWIEKRVEPYFVTYKQDSFDSVFATLATVTHHLKEISKLMKPFEKQVKDYILEPLNKYALMHQPNAFKIAMKRIAKHFEDNQFGIQMDDLTHQIQNQLSDPTLPKHLASIYKAMIWSLNYIKPYDSFYNINSDVAIQMYELSKTSVNDFIKDIAVKALEIIQNRILLHFTELYEPTLADKWNLIWILPCFYDHGILRRELLQHYNEYFPESVEYTTTAWNFTKWVEEKDYDNMYMIIDYAPLKLAYNVGLDKLIQLPKDQLETLFTAFENVNYNYTWKDDQYHGQNYYVTHIIFADTLYLCRKPSEMKIVKEATNYVMNHYPIVMDKKKVDDIDLLGEFLYIARVTGHKNEQLVKKSLTQIMNAQFPNGGWFDETQKEGYEDYSIFHPTWTSLAAINCYYTQLQGPTGHETEML